MFFLTSCSRQRFTKTRDMFEKVIRAECGRESSRADAALKSLLN